MFFCKLLTGNNFLTMVSFSQPRVPEIFQLFIYSIIYCNSLRNSLILNLGLNKHCTVVC